jgi:hypothetical protein
MSGNSSTKTRVAVLKHHEFPDIKVIAVPEGKSLDFDPGTANRAWLRPHLDDSYHLVGFAEVEGLAPEPAPATNGRIRYWLDDYAGVLETMVKNGDRRDAAMLSMTDARAKEVRAYLAQPSEPVAQHPDAVRWQKLMQLVQPTDLLPFDTDWPYPDWPSTGLRRTWAEFDAGAADALARLGLTKDGNV